MDSYAVEGLVKEVKVILDRNQESAELIPDDSDTLSQGEIIKKRLVEATKIMESNAPLYMLSGYEIKTKDSLSFQKVGDLYVGSVSLPKDLMRLLVVKMSDWERTGKVIQETDDEYAWQHSKFGVKGNPQRPIAAVVQGADGDLLMELYSCNSTTATLACTYIPLPYIDNGVIFMCKKLKEAILYMTASLVCVTLGDSDAASSMQAVAFRLADIEGETQTQ